MNSNRSDRLRVFFAAWFVFLALVTAHAAPLEQKTIPATTYLGLSRELFPEDIAAFHAEAVGVLDAALARPGLTRTGPLQFMGPAWNGAGKKSVFIIAYPITATAAVKPPLLVWTEPSYRAAILVVDGSFTAVSAGWEHIFTEAVRQGLKPNPRWTEVLHRFTTFTAPDNRTELRVGLD